MTAPRRSCERMLGNHVRGIERLQQWLVVRFAADLDAALLGEALAVERECCPFFELTYDPAARELTIAVADPPQDPALDALRHALSGSS